MLKKTYKDRVLDCNIKDQIKMDNNTVRKGTKLSTDDNKLQRMGSDVPSYITNNNKTKPHQTLTN